jgi:hypothetical protein
VLNFGVETSQEVPLGTLEMRWKDNIKSVIEGDKKSVNSN